MTTYKNISEARRGNKGKVIVYYPFGWGGQLKDRWMWCSEKDGEVIDYDERDALIDGALSAFDEVVLFTVHRGGQVTSKQVTE
jgi:hypothetical protein